MTIEGEEMNNLNDRKVAIKVSIDMANEMIERYKKKAFLKTQYCSNVDFLKEVMFEMAKSFIVQGLIFECEKSEETHQEVFYKYCDRYMKEYWWGLEEYYKELEDRNNGR